MTDHLDPHEVLEGYRKGVFPMGYLDAPVISWHLPEKRGVLPLDTFHRSRSLAHTLKRKNFTVSFDTDFEAVMRACASRGEDKPEETWITEEIVQVYSQLHREGHAHSVEVWMDGSLVGGSYGIHLGGAFFAESKFHRRKNASKIALYHLVEHLKEGGFKLLEVQFLTSHLASLGAREVSDLQYQKFLNQALQFNSTF